MSESTAKVYVLLIVFNHGSEGRTVDTCRAFTSLHGACSFVARREGRDLDWEHHDSHGTCWSTYGYRIDELELEGSRMRELHLEELVRDLLDECHAIRAGRISLDRSVDARAQRAIAGGDPRLQ